MSLILLWDSVWGLSTTSQGVLLIRTHAKQSFTGFCLIKANQLRNICFIHEHYKSCNGSSFVLCFLFFSFAIRNLRDKFLSFFKNSTAPRISPFPLFLYPNFTICTNNVLQKGFKSLGEWDERIKRKKINNCHWVPTVSQTLLQAHLSLILGPERKVLLSMLYRW